MKVSSELQTLADHTAAVQLLAGLQHQQPPAAAGFPAEWDVEAEPCGHPVPLMSPQSLLGRYLAQA